LAHITSARRILSALLFLLLALGALAGCDSSHTDKVSDIVNNPSAYAHKDVTVAGEVTRVYELPLGISDLAAYRVSDGTGQVWVLSHAGAPLVGDRVGLKGRVRPEGLVGDINLGSVIEEHERRIR